MKLNLKYNNLLDIINLRYKVYYPLHEFVSKSDFLSIVNNCRLENRKFFPFPIFINISTAQYNKFKKIKIIKAYYKSKRVCNLKLKSFYTLNKRRMGQIMFSTRDTKHPGFNDFLSSGNYFIHCKIKNFKNKIIKNLNFNSPYELKSKFIKHKLKTIAGFHTRNAPHRAHEWIHNLGLKKCDGLLIQPFVGQFKKNEYKEKILIKSNLKLVKEIYRRKNIFLGIVNAYPRYAGPREALLHAIIRRNFGCTHFLVGRDHAGIGKYYSKYQSQRLCKKYARLLKIKIISFKEPYLCASCKKIVNRKCFNCHKNAKQLINGTSIRKLLIRNLKIPDIYMRKEISNLLGSNSIIQK